MSYLLRRANLISNQGKLLFRKESIICSIINDSVKSTHRLCSSLIPIDKPQMPAMDKIVKDLNLNCYEIPSDNSAEFKLNNLKQNSLLRCVQEEPSRVLEEELQRPFEEELRSSLILQLSNSNSDEKSLELIYFTKVLLLLEKENNYLRRAFINTWNAVEDQKWVNSAENHERFIEKIGTFFLNSDSYHQMLISSRNINTWDSDILIESLRILDAQIPFDVINEIEVIKNNMCDFTNEKYHELWRQLSILLLELDVPPKEIDEWKPSIINQPTQQLSQKLNLQVRILKDWGQKAFKEGLFKESIEYYSKAIHTPGISYDELCELYYARSAVHRQCKDNSSAERDVSCALYFHGLVQKVKN